jgi:hypothetical protein
VNAEPDTGPDTGDATGTDAGDAGVDRGPGGRWFWLGLAAGWSVMAFAVWGIFADRDATNPAGLARWALGGALAHDLLLAPAVLLIGAVLARWLPPSVRGPISGALALTGTAVLFAYPSVRGCGHHELNPSTLPLDYRTNVLTVVGLIWVATVSIIVIRTARRGRP